MVDIFDGDFKGKSTSRQPGFEPTTFSPEFLYSYSQGDFANKRETETNKLKAIEIDSGLDDMKSLEARH